MFGFRHAKKEVTSHRIWDGRPVWFVRPFFPGTASQIVDRGPDLPTMLLKMRPSYRILTVLSTCFLLGFSGCASGRTAALRELHAGNAAETEGRNDEAVKHYRKAVALDPTFGDAHNNLGLAYAKQGRLEDAMAEWRRAIEVQPGHPRAHFNLGRAQEERGSLAEAAESYRKSVAGDPRNAAAFVNLGNVLKALGQLEQAERAYQQALEVHPEYAGAHYNLGLLYSRQRRYAQAVTAFEKACRLGMAPACESEKQARSILKTQ